MNETDALITELRELAEVAEKHVTYQTFVSSQTLRRAALTLAQRGAEIAELRATLEKVTACADQYRFDAECRKGLLELRDGEIARLRAHIVAMACGSDHSHQCIECHARYTPPQGSSEDCPVCGCDGTGKSPTIAAQQGGEG